jgi:NAD(P)H dehydrogenase (quinone)
MHVLLVYAHPEPASLNGAIRDAALAHLRAQGHTVELSDLYALRWKAALDGDDFPASDRSRPLDVARDSRRAFADGAQSPDVAAEQAKLDRADLVLFQFPLWWFTVPAILKGWFERVYAHGYAYGVGEHSDRRWGDRYGEGVFAGKRAMLLVTTGGWAEHYGARGINGPIDDLLFPIQHGLLFYPGFAVLPPFVLYRVDKLNAIGFERAVAALRARLDGAHTDAPIPYRVQNAGDYRIPAMTLRDELGAGRSGFALHCADEG